MSEKLRDYFFKVSENLRAHDLGDQEREEELLADLDHLWLEMSEEEAAQSDMVGRFALAMHERDLQAATELFRNNAFLRPILAPAGKRVRTGKAVRPVHIKPPQGHIFSVVSASTVAATSAPAWRTFLHASEGCLIVTDRNRERSEDYLASTDYVDLVVMQEARA